MGTVSAPLMILQVCSARPWTGDAAACFELAKGLSRAGELCTIACSPDSELRRRALAAGLRILPVVIRGEADWVAAKTLRSFVEAHDVDVLHAHDRVALAVTALAGRGQPARRVVSCSSHAPIAGRLGRWALRLGADHVLATSLASRRAVLASGVPLSRVSVVLRGTAIPPDRRNRAHNHTGTGPSAARWLMADQARARRAQLGIGPGDHPVIGTMGSLIPGKGIEDLIHAVRLMLPAHPRLTLVVIGDGPEQNALGALITRAGLGDSVRLAGFIDHGANALPEFDVYCAPAVTRPSLGALSEALAASRPVVACPMGAVAELVHHERTGLLAPSADPAALAQAISRLLDAPHWARGLGHAGRRLIRERHSLAGMVSNTRRTYVQLLAAQATDTC